MPFITREFDCTMPDGSVMRMRQANQFGAACDAARKTFGDWYKAFPCDGYGSNIMGTREVSTLEMDGDFKVALWHPRKYEYDAKDFGIIRVAVVEGTERDEATPRRRMVTK